MIYFILLLCPTIFILGENIALEFYSNVCMKDSERVHPQAHALMPEGWQRTGGSFGAADDYGERGSHEFARLLVCFVLYNKRNEFNQ